MKKIINILALGFSFLMSNSTLAGPWDYTDAYSTTRGSHQTPTTVKWMSSLPDSTYIRKMSIPGTHDSASDGPGGWAAQNQTMTLTNQLNSGIRFMDFRCKDFDLNFHHGIFYLYKSCTDGFQDAIEFLKKNKTETILIRLKQEESSLSNERFTQAVLNMLNKLDKQYIWNPKQDKNGQPVSYNSNPTLGDVRGKIIILTDWFTGDKDLGLYYNSFRKHDNYHMTTNWDLYYKWKDLKGHILFMSLLNLPMFTEPYDSWVTTIVGSGGSFPYFVASGRSSIDGPHLLTGLTTPGWSSSYPDFPRSDCFIGICSIFFSGLNELTTWYYNENRFSLSLGYAGIIAADFPGPSLIKTVIEQNAKHWIEGGVAEKGDIYVYKNPYASNMINYFYAKKSGKYGYFPINMQDNDDWTYAGFVFPVK